MAGSITQRAKTAVGNRAKVRLRNVALEVEGILETIKVRMVEDIEHLRAELDVVSLSHTPILIHGEVEVINGLTADRPLAQAAKLSDTRYRERRRIEPQGAVVGVVDIDGHALHQVRSRIHVTCRTEGVNA